jgi:hypothetical protein
VVKGHGSGKKSEGEGPLFTKVRREFNLEQISANRFFDFENFAAGYYLNLKNF